MDEYPNIGRFTGQTISLGFKRSHLTLSDSKSVWEVQVSEDPQCEIESLCPGTVTHPSKTVPLFTDTEIEAHEDTDKI